MVVGAVGGGRHAIFEDASGKFITFRPWDGCVVLRYSHSQNRRAGDGSESAEAGRIGNRLVFTGDWVNANKFEGS